MLRDGPCYPMEAPVSSPAEPFVEIAPGLLSWSRWHEEKQVHFNGFVVVDPAGNVVSMLSMGPGWPGDVWTPGSFLYRVEKVPELIVDTPSDTDGDSDVDLHDFLRMQRAFTGASPASLEFPATLSDHDGDDDIDSDDVALFAHWMTGPAR